MPHEFSFNLTRKIAHSKHRIFLNKVFFFQFTAYSFLLVYTELSVLLSSTMVTRFLPDGGRSHVWYIGYPAAAAVRKVDVEGYCRLGTRDWGFMTAGCRPKVPPMTLANWVRWGSGQSWCISWPPADSINSWLLPLPPTEGSSKASCEEILICCCWEGHSTVVGWTMVPL